MLAPQSCLTLWDPMDCSPPGPSVHGVLGPTLNYLFKDSVSKYGHIPKYWGLGLQRMTEGGIIQSMGLSRWLSGKEEKSESVNHSVVSDSLRCHELWPTKLLCPRNSPGKNTGVGCHSFLQGSSQPRGWTWVSSITVRFFNVWTTKNLPAMQEMPVNPWDGKIPWRRKWLPTPVFLPGKSHGQRSLVGYSRWGSKRTEHALAA